MIYNLNLNDDRASDRRTVRVRVSVTVSVEGKDRDTGKDDSDLEFYFKLAAACLHAANDSRGDLEASYMGYWATAGSRVYKMYTFYDFLHDILL